MTSIRGVYTTSAKRRAYFCKGGGLSRYFSNYWGRCDSPDFMGVMNIKMVKLTISITLGQPKLAKPTLAMHAVSSAHWPSGRPTRR